MVDGLFSVVYSRRCQCLFHSHCLYSNVLGEEVESGDVENCLESGPTAPRFPFSVSTLLETCRANNV